MTSQVRLAFYACIFSLLVSGCSESSSSSSAVENDISTAGDFDIGANYGEEAVDDDSGVDDSTGAAVAEPEDGPSSEGAADDGAGTGDSTTAAAVEPGDVPSSEGAANGDGGTDDSTSAAAAEPEDGPLIEGEHQSAISDAGVPDPEIRSRTYVNFEITVPAYQSSELQLRLVWGEIEITAEWIGDEHWGASADFPAATERPLVVTFYDKNGQIILGTHEQLYTTGSNESELLRISAAQFDTERWDSDGDGMSNIDELIAQSDPLVDEAALLEVVDSVGISLGLTVSADFESRLSEQRPFVESVKDLLPVPEDGPVSSYERNVDIMIDADGNGTFYDLHQQEQNRGSYYRLFALDGIRTNSGSAITWEGSRRYKDDALNGTTTSIDFTNEVSIVDGTTRSIVETISSYQSEFYFYSTRIDTNLIGSMIGTSPLCKPVSGSVKITNSTNSTGTVETITTLIGKEAGDTYWNVTVTGQDAATKDEYLARTLESKPFEFGGYENSEADFICEFIDW